jgi:RNA polymerase sigma factor (sigma-70 family)
MGGGGDDGGQSGTLVATLACHDAAVRSAARAICRNPGEVDDLVQDTFERALRFLSAGHAAPHSPRAWLISILRHVFIDRMRTRAARPTVDTVDELPAPEPLPEPIWASVTPAEVRAALADLEPGLRRAFELHYLQGLRYKDIAAELQIPDNTVASRLHRARKALKEALSPRHHPEHEESPDAGRLRAER